MVFLRRGKKERKFLVRSALRSMVKYVFLVVLGIFCVSILRGNAAGLAEQLVGRVLLAVESHGEAWYVSPDGERYALPEAQSALQVFQSQALGITNTDLAQIPLEESLTQGNLALRSRLSGYVLLAVESH